MTRRHQIHWHAPEYPRLISVLSGKLSTFRETAEDAVDAVMHVLRRPHGKCITRNRIFPGASGNLTAVGDALARRGFQPGTVRHLVDVYGVRALDVARLADDDKSLAQVIDAATGAVAAEVVFVTYFEWAKSIGDIVQRRTMIGLGRHIDDRTLDRIAQIAGDALGWADTRIATEVLRYRQEMVRHHGPSPISSEALG